MTQVSLELGLLSAGIIGVNHHTLFPACFYIELTNE
jgi:hypothetical protein